MERRTSYAPGAVAVLGALEYPGARIAIRLALGVLRSAAGALEAVLLALLDT